MQDRSEMRERAVVLVVEDEPIVRFCAVEMLRDAGYEVLEAAAGDEALKLIEARSDIGVLFTDIEMPGTIDGHALVEIARARQPAMRVVLTSGRMRPRTEELPPLVLFLAKPYRPDDLISVVGGDRRYG